MTFLLAVKTYLLNKSSHVYTWLTSKYIRGRLFTVPLQLTVNMNHSPLWKNSLERTSSGTFERKYPNESKKLRTIRLTDTAWNYLQRIADQESVSRTDVIEAWARERVTQSDILCKALDEFVEMKKQEYGLNNAQKGEFNRKSRDWTYFNKFVELAKNAPWELLGEDVE